MGVSGLLKRFTARLEYAWHRIRNGDEPVFVFWVVSMAAAIAAKFGFEWIDADSLWLYLGVSFPTMATARNKVSPSEVPKSWKEVLTGVVSRSEPDIELDPETDAGPAGQVDPADLDDEGEPIWLEEYMGNVVVLPDSEDDENDLTDAELTQAWAEAEEEVEIVDPKEGGDDV
jgi:hypothetical protein